MHHAVNNAVEFLRPIFDESTTKLYGCERNHLFLICMWFKHFTLIDIITYIVNLIKICLYNCERSGTKPSELDLESFFPQSYETFNQRDISEIIDFSDML